MKGYQFVKFRKVWIKLFVFVVMCGITMRLLPTYSSEYLSRSNIHLGCDVFDTRMTPKHLFQSFFAVLNDSSWLAKPASYSPSFQELHSLLFGLDAPNLYESWPNYFKKTVDPTYLHTSLTQSLFTKILEEIDIPVTFVIEVGSFMGKSAINIGKVLIDNKSGSPSVLLCIDTWLGGLEDWMENDLRQMMGIAYGRPIVYEQFIANIIANNLTNHLIPYSTTSILGARFLLEKKLFPQVIYLDSAHLQGETYVELELYWSLLQTGGILIGTDWSWLSVRCDVLRFIDSNKANVTTMWNTWYIRKEKSF
jgi:hypothetical protein